jgi:EmrB/QacA subfamily drug resistance transporter
MVNLNNPDATQVPFRRGIIIFIVVSLALLMSSINSTVVTVCLPDILKNMNTSLAWTSWVITGFQLASSVMMPIIGKLSDDWGRKRLFLIAVAIFTASSLGSGLAPNIYWLIVFRVLQGMSGGAFLPSATGIVSDAFGARRTTYIGLFASIFPIGGIIGPNIGGFLIDHMSWRWTFFINIPLGFLLLLLGIFIIPKGSINPSRQKVDFSGAGLFIGAMLALLFGLTDWANDPQHIGITTWILLPAGFILFILFLRREGRVSNPMIDLQLLKWKPFLAANIYNFLYGAVVFGMFSFFPYYSTLAYNTTGSQNGLILTPRSAAAVILGAISSFLLIKFRYRLPMIVGSVVICLSFVLLGQGFHDLKIFGFDINNIAVLYVISVLGGIGMGIANPAANNAILDMVPGKVGSVVGMRGMFRMSGGVFGTAGVVLVLSYFQDKAQGMEHISLFFAAIMLGVIPLIFMIPDSARNRNLKSGGLHE